MTPDRTKVVQFSRTFGVETNTIVMNSPDLHQAKNIFDPFDKLGGYLGYIVLVFLREVSI